MPEMEYRQDTGALSMMKKVKTEHLCNGGKHQRDKDKEHLTVGI